MKILEDVFKFEECEVDPDLYEIDPDHLCEQCQGHLTIGDHQAYGLCGDCYWKAFEEE